MQLGQVGSRVFYTEGQRGEQDTDETLNRDRQKAVSGAVLVLQHKY